METPTTNSQPGNAEQPQPPYGIILNALKSGNVVPFLGAGASLLSAADGGMGLPSGAALSEYLAIQARFPSTDTHDRTDLAKVTSYYVDVSGRKLLRQALRSKFAQNYQCNRLHRLLARISDKTTIVTTNYDNLLEQAFTEAGKPYDVVVYPADNDEYANGFLWWHHGKTEPTKLKPNEIDIDDLGKTNVIYKMHGTVWPASAAWDSFVITEEDYVQFLSRINNAVPSAFRTYFRARQFLFLGYGLRDWNLRVLLKKVRPEKVSSSDDVSWAIMKNASLFERTLWDGRKVKLYDVDLDAFVTEMESELNR